uniref:hypothetical protein n=1 Tax=Desulfurobacterium sp. TaxID=2004706 RepID=UPI00263348D0
MLAKRTAERVLNTYTPVFIERIANGEGEGDITKVLPEVFDAVEGEYSRVLSDLLESERKKWLEFFKENPVEGKVNIDPFIGQIAYLSVEDYSKFWDDVRNLILGKENENREYEYGILCGVAGNLLLTLG